MSECSKQKIVIRDSVIENLDRNESSDSEHPQSVICTLTDLFNGNLRVNLANITHLKLNDCGIDTFPHSIKKLPLRQLELSHNKLKEVPSCLFSGLEQLEIIDLSFNLLQNFDVEPACCLNLQKLDLSNNAIYNLPQWILVGRCLNLQSLCYSHNYVSHLKTEHKLRIKKLEFCNSALIDEDLIFFKELRQLEHLDIGNDNIKSNKSENRLRDIEQLFIQSKWKQLQILKLDNLSLSILPDDLFKTVTLTELSLVNCQLSWIPKEIANFTKLISLDITQNEISSIPPQIGELQNLKVIHASNNHISWVPQFSQQLEILDLYDNYMETFSSNLDNIKMIDLEMNHFVSCELCDNSYKDKCALLRNSCRLNRIQGPRESVTISEFSDDKTTDVSSSSGLSQQESRQDDFIEENWDDDNGGFKEELIERHPEITPSDDEWQGAEEIKRDPKRKSVEMKKRKISEESIFCDAD